MKKTYISPATMVTVVNTEIMIASSPLSGTNVEGLGMGGTTDGNVTTAGVKQDNYSVWDDDWSK